MAFTAISSIAIFFRNKASELLHFVASYTSSTVPVLVEASATVDSGEELSEADRLIISLLLCKSSHEMVLPQVQVLPAMAGSSKERSVGAVAGMTSKGSKEGFKNKRDQVVYANLASKLAAAPKTSMAAVKDVVSLYQLLKAEWAKKPVNLEKCGDLLAKLKVLYYVIQCRTYFSSVKSVRLRFSHDLTQLTNAFH